MTKYLDKNVVFKLGMYFFLESILSDISCVFYMCFYFLFVFVFLGN